MFCFVVSESISLFLHLLFEPSDTTSTRNDRNGVDYYIYPRQQDEPFSLYVAVNVRNATELPVWLSDCQLPMCTYQIFSDAIDDGASGIRVYPSQFARGRQHFGYRGRFQFTEALINTKCRWTHFLRVDEDGYLCLNKLLQKKLPSSNFLAGRFHCRGGNVRMDENYMLLTRDAISYFVRGWEEGVLPFDGRLTLALNVGAALHHLHYTCGWTFWDDRDRIRWDEPLDGISCDSHVWMHHLSRDQAMVMYSHHHPDGDEAVSRPFGNVTQPFVNQTGCKRLGTLLPAFEDPSRIRFLDADGNFSFGNLSMVSHIPCHLN
jgi:hypothetical protein